MRTEDKKKKGILIYMRKIIFSIALVITTLSSYSQNLSDLSFGTDSTFEVMSWNLEWFPTNGQSTIDSVAIIIEALDIDVFAIQEVNNEVQFAQLINSLDGWEGYYQESDYLEVGYIYKSESIELDSIYEILTADEHFRPLPRSPLAMEFSFMNHEMVIINVHLKCCGDGTLDLNDEWDEETRRYDACNLIDNYIAENYADKNVILVGDMNDLIQESAPNNVFETFITDSANYLITDMDIANGGNAYWSYPTWPSHIDHIFITSELFDEFENGTIETIRIEDYLSGGFNEYESNISDHRPLAIKLAMEDLTSGIENIVLDESSFSIYPNPSNANFTFSIDLIKSKGIIEIYSSDGKLIEQVQINQGQTNISFNASQFPNGFYYAKLIVAGRVSVKKMMLVK